MPKEQEVLVYARSDGREPFANGSGNFEMDKPETESANASREFDWGTLATHVPWVKACMNFASSSDRDFGSTSAGRAMLS